MSKNTDRLRSFGKTMLDGLIYLGEALSDDPKKVRIKEIDELMRDLNQERDHLIASLINPGNLEVSALYDPNWTGPKSAVATPDPEGGRLTLCAGRLFENSDIHDTHPACPYYATKHIKHEFMLRD